MRLLKISNIWTITVAAVLSIAISSCDLLGGDDNENPSVSNLKVASDVGDQGTAAIEGDIKDDNTGVTISMAVLDTDGKDVKDNFDIQFKQVDSDKKKWDLKKDAEATIAIKAAACKGDYKLKITAKDADGAEGSNSADFKVTADGSACASSTGTPATTKTIEAGSNQHASLGSSIDLDAGVAYLMSQAASKVSDLDICYSYSGTDNVDKLFSPSHAKASGFTYAANWSNPPATKFYKTDKSKADFDAITTKEAITALWDDSKAQTTSVTAAANDVFIVKTTAGATALVLIESQNSGAAGSITIKSTL